MFEHFFKMQILENLVLVHPYMVEWKYHDNVKFL